MKDLICRAVDAARSAGAGYSDARIVRHRRQHVAAEDERISSVGSSDEIGIGIRVIADGRWGFAATRELTPEAVSAAAQTAVSLARASAAPGAEEVQLAEEPAVDGDFTSPYRIDPFTVSIEDKCGLLQEANERMLAVSGVKKANSLLAFKRDEKMFASSEGAFFQSDIVTSRVRISATAVGDNDARSRSYQPPIQTRGWESIDRSDVLENCARVGEQAVEHLRAPEGPTGTMDLVLDPLHLALTIHESVGHATELDRVLGMEESLSGKSFATLDKVGSFKYGSPLINFVADNTLEGGLATWGFDDEGVPGQRWDIVREGILRGYSTSREVARAVGESRSRGGCRADHWGRLPIVRIPNLCLAPGSAPCSPEELIAGVDDGIYIEGMGSFSIDNMRLNMQFGGDAFWRIRKGKLDGMLKNVIYQSITPRFWGACDGLTDERFWQPNGLVNCGKGDPMQTQQMTHAAPYARFRGISVGGVW